MDLFNMIYSTNTVGEHPIESKWNDFVFILKSSIFSKINIYPDKTALRQDLNGKVLKANGLV